jgi:hypothetical protein
MSNINIRKRAAHRRRVQMALQEILNDPTVMPNTDGRDLLVSVSRVEFGKTVWEIYLAVQGQAKQALAPGEEQPHDCYMREARIRGQDTYADLTDVFVFPGLTQIVAKELQRRLGLLYTPEIRRLCDLGVE